ncbi:hypothetical protein Bpfe_001761 [Biomphalaria pfeifferi]|uniref:Uncharacterized protein n=1 Tax=Biomphalaria pfeifferi TaxID=112525 RepID=A0AAD8CAG8_BIOPF|nr:hypothetical protein Bpfe_001761 [Biomphalaria pfeifferi]
MGLCLSHRNESFASAQPNNGILSVRLYFFNFRPDIGQTKFERRKKKAGRIAVPTPRPCQLSFATFLRLLRNGFVCDSNKLPRADNCVFHITRRQRLFGYCALSFFLAAKNHQDIC